MKQIIWIGNSYQTLLGFSKTAKQLAGYNLERVQRGLEPTDWKPMASIGMGVREIRLHAENEYRVIYIANFDDGVYVLHTFVKKTQKTTQKDINIAKQRFKDAVQARKK